MKTHKISIHAPRAGSDVFTSLHIEHIRKFQSTLPVRGATAKMHKKRCFFAKKHKKYANKQIPNRLNSIIR